MIDLFNGFVNLFTNIEALLFVFLAAFVGIVAGALPGLTASAAIAMLLPLSFHLGPLSALAFLYVIGKSGRYGGSIAAILFNTPGTAASAATMQDGYPMTQQGKAGKALKTATMASVFGDFFGEFILIFGAVIIAAYTSDFGPTEYFCIYVMAFIVIGSVVGKSVIKGILSTLFGAIIALIGLDTISGEPRMTMGFIELEDGLALVPLLIGVFVISEIIIQAEHAARQGLAEAYKIRSEDPDANHLTWAEFVRCIPLMLRSSTVGSFIGMMPGLGSSVACFVAYGEEKRRAKEPEKWGTGIVEGIAAPESANNAVSGPSMIPLLTLGIPGSTIAAILIGVFLIHGIQVGPTVFTNPTSRELIFSLFAAGLVGIAAYGVIGYWGGPMIGRIIAYLPARLLYPFIFLTAIAASYSSRASILDVVIALIFGVVGYVMRRTEFSTAAFVIAFVLARNAEEAFRQALLLSDDGILIFVKEPVALTFLIVGLAVLVLRSVSVMRQSQKAAAAAT
ncbi:MAG: tripartite tricarboxylate transporter permease, partial [Hyphomicrobiaceae bacterium]